MAQLVRDGEVLAGAEIATTHRRRRRGLLGRRGTRDAFVIPRCRQVHTIGMCFPIDVLWCAADGRVLHTARLAPGRISRWVRRARFVVEAEAGSTQRWHIGTGDVLEVAS
jgi:uncharacterized membrane protein (UPF0127 family)